MYNLLSLETAAENLIAVPSKQLGVFLVLCVHERWVCGQKNNGVWSRIMSDSSTVSLGTFQR